MTSLETETMRTAGKNISADGKAFGDTPYALRDLDATALGEACVAAVADARARAGQALAEVLADVSGQAPPDPDAAEAAENPPTEPHEAVVADGAVTAVVGPDGTLREVRIAANARRTIDNLTLGEHVRDAIQAAEEQAEQARTAVLGRITIGGRSVADIMADPGGALRTPPYQRRRR
ncbi:YbaB/EbfC family nucleoid-associated protein [Actinoplanes sp. NPDC051851]|uniref:YbaB/EbfC family nucleoid-associated protein n=1 Tax=Actinoplanes sp. NPDC051851 TaxID=3154753 RepID=UPI00342BF7E6